MLPFESRLRDWFTAMFRGFFGRALRRQDVQIVGIFEQDHALADRYQSRFHLDAIPIFSDLEAMLQKTRPQAVLVYTNTYDHRRVIEMCARHGIHAMMEKPLAVSMDDARAIERAARQ